MLFDGLPDEYSSLVMVGYNGDTLCLIWHSESMIIAHEERLDRVKKHSVDDVASVLLTQSLCQHRHWRRRLQW